MDQKEKINLIEGNHDQDCVQTDESARQALRAQRHIIKSFKSRFNAKRKWYDKFADFMTEEFGTIGFFVANLIWYVVWMTWNSDLITWLPKFDPYPFNFLTMMVSLEAIFLSIIVLISQNRSSGIADMREEIDFNINVRAEQEITKILVMLQQIQTQLGLGGVLDEELEEMEQQLDLEQMEQQISSDYDKKKEN
jgi:uncharacterized membrane protein